MWWCDILWCDILLDTVQLETGKGSKGLSVDIVLLWNQDCPLLAQPQFSYSQVAPIQWFFESRLVHHHPPTLDLQHHCTLACLQANKHGHQPQCLHATLQRANNRFNRRTNLEDWWDCKSPDVQKSLKETHPVLRPNLTFFVPKRASLSIQWPHRNVQELQSAVAVEWPPKNPCGSAVASLATEGYTRRRLWAASHSNTAQSYTCQWGCVQKCHISPALISGPKISWPPIST